MESKQVPGRRHLPSESHVINKRRYRLNTRKQIKSTTQSKKKAKIDRIRNVGILRMKVNVVIVVVMKNSLKKKLLSLPEMKTSNSKISKTRITPRIRYIKLSKRQLSLTMTSIQRIGLPIATNRIHLITTYRSPRTILLSTKSTR